MEELGQRLRSFRLENGWSKRATAEHLGVSVPSILRWESGDAVPNGLNRTKIDQLLESFAAARDGRRMIQLSLFPRQIPSALARS